MIYSKSKESNYQKRTSGLSGARVKTSALLADKRDSSKALKAPCSLKLSDALKNELGGGEDVTCLSYHGKC